MNTASSFTPNHYDFPSPVKHKGDIYQNDWAALTNTVNMEIFTISSSASKS